jgi:hypothetical protein
LADRIRQQFRQRCTWDTTTAATATFPPNLLSLPPVDYTPYFALEGHFLTISRQGHDNLLFWFLIGLNRLSRRHCGIEADSLSPVLSKAACHLLWMTIPSGLHS